MGFHQNSGFRPTHRRAARPFGQGGLGPLRDHFAFKPQAAAHLASGAVILLFQPGAALTGQLGLCLFQLMTSLLHTAGGFLILPLPPCIQCALWHVIRWRTVRGGSVIFKAQAALLGTRRIRRWLCPALFRLCIRGRRSASVYLILEVKPAPWLRFKRFRISLGVFCRLSCVCWLFR